MDLGYDTAYSAYCLVYNQQGLVKSCWAIHNYYFVINAKFGKKIVQLKLNDRGARDSKERHFTGNQKICKLISRPV